jgi:hypothetical protein
VGQISGSRRSVRVKFPEPEWDLEVARLAERSMARQQAEHARRKIEARRVRLRWLRCDAAEAVDRTWLPLCWKLYVPLDASGPSAAPYGFVFELIGPSAGITLSMIAFGERHPTNPNTKSVYERAHRRLHGRYP